MTSIALNSPQVVNGRFTGGMIGSWGIPWLENPVGSGQVYKINTLSLLFSLNTTWDQAFVLTLVTPAGTYTLCELLQPNAGSNFDFVKNKTYIYLEEGCSINCTLSIDSYDHSYNISYDVIGAPTPYEQLWSFTEPNLISPQFIKGKTICKRLDDSGFILPNDNESGQVYKITGFTWSMNTGKYTNQLHIFIMRFDTMLAPLGAAYFNNMNNGTSYTENVISDKNPIYLVEGDALLILPYWYIPGSDSSVTITYEVIGSPDPPKITLEVNVEKTLV